MLTGRDLVLSGTLLPISKLAVAADVVPLPDVPAHLQFAVQAAAQKVAGFAPDPNEQKKVEFSAGALTAFQGLSVKPIGFKLVGATLKGLSVSKKSNIPRIAVSGALTYASSSGRRAIVAFTLLYAFVGNRLRIEYASLAPVLPDKPMVMTYLIPGAVRDSDVISAKPTFEAVRSQIVQSAYDLHKPNQLQSGTYVVAVAVFDWLPDTIPMNLWISKDRNRIDPPPGPNILAYFKGWRIYLRHITLDFADIQKYYLKVAWSNPADALLSTVDIVSQSA